MTKATSGKRDSSQARPAAPEMPPSGMRTTSSNDAADYLAKKKGLSAKELIERDLAAMRAEGARPVECLHVSDIEDSARGVPFSEAMQAHVAQCPNCAALLELSKPTQEREEAFLQAVREVDGVFRMMVNASARR